MKNICRKSFIGGLCSLIGISAMAHSSSNDIICKNSSLDAYYRYLAERYVDSWACGPYDDNNGKGAYYAVAPVGFVYSPSRKAKTIVEIPVIYRRVYSSDTYNVVLREKLISNLKTYFAEQGIHQKLSEVKA